MGLRYKFGLVGGLGVTAYVMIYGATQGVDPLILFLVAVLGVGLGVLAMLVTSWLFDRFYRPPKVSSEPPPDGTAEGDKPDVGGRL